MRQQENKGFNLFVFLLVSILALVFFVQMVDSENQRKSYTRSEFIRDMEAGKTLRIRIQLNPETPTGAVQVMLVSGDERVFYVTDVKEIEEVIRSHGYEPIIQDVERDSWIMTTLVPILVVLLVGVFLFMIVRAQNVAAGNNNAKMMNFGKSRAKMIMGDKNITFAQVAGLQEEKEELEEIVDFLKTP